MAAKGTKVADVFIGIGGDLTAYRDELKKAPKEAEGVGAQIRAALSGKGATQAGFGGFISDLKLGSGLTTALRNNLRGMASDLRRVSTGTIEAGLSRVEHVGAHVFGHLKSLAGEVFKGFAVGAGIAGFLGLERVVEKLTSAIPELINRSREYIESVHTLTIETGATSERASALLAVYQFLGGTSTDLNQKINRLSVTVKTNEDAFNSLGVDTRDANGNLLDQITIVDNLRHVFANLPEGPEKTRLALLSFGRNGATALGPLLHYLNLTDEQVKQLTDDAQKQGLILSEGQVLTADAVGKAQARIGNAITGLANILFSQVGPKLAAFFDGLADFITSNAQRVSDAISGIVAQVVGLVQGLFGINLSSFSAQFSNVAEGGSQWAGALIDDEAALKKLQSQLNPTASAVDANNTAIDKQIKGLNAAGRAAEESAKRQTDALDAESAALDRQADKIKHLGDVQDTVFKREIANLTRAYDAELALLDAEDRRAARAAQAEQDTRNETAAEQDLYKAKRALADAQVDLANAQAQYDQDLADPKSDPQKLAQDLLDIASASDKVRDATQGIHDAQQGLSDAQAAFGQHAKDQAEEDRRAQIEAIKAYVQSIADIVEQSDNKKAALNTLKRREAKLQDELELARQKGNAQEVTDIETKLAAVRKGEGQLGNDIKNQADLDAIGKRKAAIEEEKKLIQSVLETRKQELADEVAALTESKQSQTAVSRAELNKQIADLKTKIAEDKKHLAEEQAAQKALHDEIDQGLISNAENADKVLDPAFERARLAGIKMADDIKNAIGGLLDILLGPESTVYRGGGTAATGPRSGGLFGALSSIAGGFAGVASGVKDVLAGLSQFNPKDVALAVMGVGAYFKNPAVILAGAFLYGGLIAAESPATVASAAAAPAPNSGGGAGFPGAPVGFDPAEVAKSNIAALLKADPAAIYRYSLFKSGPLAETNAHALARLQAEFEARVFTRGGYEQGGLIPGQPHVPQWVYAHGAESVMPVDVTRRLLDLAEQGGLMDADRSGFVIENHTHLHLPWDNRAIDFISRELAYRRRN